MRRWRRWSGSSRAAMPQWLFEPADATIWSRSLTQLDPDMPVMALGLGSNMIVRDGGVPGVTVRLGKAFAKIERLDEVTLQLRRRGERHPGFLDRARCRHRRARIPARHSRHGRRLRADERRRLWPRGAGYPGLAARSCCATARSRNGRPSGSVTPIATPNCPRARWWSRRSSAASPGEPQIDRRRDGPRSPRAREESQPLRSRTGGSTFKNPPGHKAWALVDAAGCRGLTHRRRASVGEALQFPSQSRQATSSSDIEELGEEVRRRVQDKTNITLEWEIQRSEWRKRGEARQEPEYRRADGRLVVRARSVADERQGRRRCAARARLHQRHPGRHGPQRRPGAGRHPARRRVQRAARHAGRGRHGPGPARPDADPLHPQRARDLGHRHRQGTDQDGAGARTASACRRARWSKARASTTAIRWRGPMC